MKMRSDCRQGCLRSQVIFGIERMDMIRKLKDDGLALKEIAFKLNKTESWVKDYSALMKAMDEKKSFRP